MDAIEIIEESILVLKTNRLRTGLSILGIIIGIGSVIALMTLGQASGQSIKERIQALGTNLLMVRPGNSQQGFLRGGSSGTTLTNEDALAIKESLRVTTVTDTAADYSGRAQILFERNNANTQVTGVYGNYFKIRNIQIQIGSLIDNSSSQDMEKVAVLGTATATDLFGDGVNPIGKMISIQGKSFKVIGVTKSKGGSGASNQDEAVYIPLYVAQKALFGVNHISTIYVEAKDAGVMDAARNQIGFLLLERHRKATPTDADFSISSQEDILETANQITGTFTTLLSGIAAISLLVGGIGIMNIMFVTVTERTREIGLRKALGAKEKTIVAQFLVEAIILTLSGGIVGVILGIGASLILTKVMSLPVIIAYHSIGLAVFVSSLIGIIFGWYPAYKASKLTPIEALRYE